ncbi:MAG: Fic family protein [Paludibacteraceae bacterium]|nr:Fic family protein [Paludibacteraceae bacterium]
MSEQKHTPHNFKYADIFLGCYFTEYLIENYEKYLTGNLQDLLLDIDSLRKKQEDITINPRLFLELKQTFRLLVSLCTARAEGNNISITEYLKAKANNTNNLPNEFKEIENLHKAINYINEKKLVHGFDKEFILKLHQILTNGIDKSSIHGTEKAGTTPGSAYRKNNPKLTTDLHLPPHWDEVDEYMEKLCDFINQENESQYDFIKAAIAQYRFIWIYPFDSENEKLSRLLSYAIVLKSNLNKKDSAKFNPAIVLCKNRYLNQAITEQNTDNGIINRLEAVFKNIKEDIEKVNMLADYSYLERELLNPCINRCLEKNFITENQATILHNAVEKQIIQASDVKEVYSYKSDTEISREIKKLIDKKLILKESMGTRKYVLSLENNYILGELFCILIEKGFVQS